jgi:hypothetical protein
MGISQFSGMRKHSFRSGPVPIYILVTLVGILLFISGCLYRQKTEYQNQNRQLIIQNDSVMSVNIELVKTLEIKKPSSIENPPVRVESKEK